MPQTQGVCPWVERVVSVANVERETTGPSGGGESQLKSKQKTQGVLRREQVVGSKNSGAEKQVKLLERAVFLQQASNIIAGVQLTSTRNTES